MSSGNPFVVEEALVALTVAGTEKWIGGCAQQISLSRDFREQALEYPGVAYGQVKHVDENHVIEIENLWLSTGADVGGKMPELQRNQTYKLVLVWFDEETGCFAKRTYHGVTGRSQRVRAPLQNVVWRAERMVESTGLADVPDLTPDP